MKILPIVIVFLVGLSSAHAGAVDELLQEYRSQGAGPFSAEAGAALWTRSGGAQTCAACHDSDLRTGGRHAKTGKPIAPMAPSVNAKRLTDRAFIEKWFKRNCDSAWGRACTPQEKGDFLSYLRNQ
ncbi:DUF1924 domain-containing protein [Sulfurivermis fontis]|jgi:hypothetical protein|uniref:DUF1924 domain-containing protein n=1 Tax=Sulfurivermis fontis TaxID=1972068 RepID=UPI000FDC3852|nr:DUF1924 domain-containing protein [Sulfurivermis fontis]